MEMFQQFVLLCLCIFHLAALVYAQHEADDAYDRVRWPYNLHEWDQHQKLLMLMVAMMIHQFHGLKENLQADPCAPQDYLWKGLNCSYPNDDSPRITSLFV
ncbi:hypothetical protein WN944_003538 [Citrus x changshan-huyou]|uniref:Leucine-rich repeat-containing N-terminal plant-type domain-containing protein n=1 Tax=Citrus x changshan-huyou TaxID=2935761 RepID=A0AAP0M1T7_9ROSI